MTASNEELVRVVEILSKFAIAFDGKAVPAEIQWDIETIKRVIWLLKNPVAYVDKVQQLLIRNI